MGTDWVPIEPRSGADIALGWGNETMVNRAKGPWYWKEKKAFYVKIRGKRIRLGTDEKQAWIKYHDLMGETTAAPEKPIVIDEGFYTVSDLFEVYLRHVHQNKAEGTYNRKRDYLRQFLKDNPDHAVRLAEKLKPVHLTDWVNRHKSWGDTYRHTLISAVQIAFSWAKRQGMISADHLKGMEKPTPQKKKHDEYLKREDYETLLKHIPTGDPFRDLLEFLWETGCRPQEAFRLEFNHVDLKRQAAIMKNVKAKGPATRVITLNAPATAIVERQDRREGFVFLNTRGNPWTKDAVKCRLVRLEELTGIKTTAYQFRHGFATDLLENNVDVATVSTLMGHKDTRMVSSTYSHLIDKQDFLRDALNQRKSKQE